MSSPERVRIAPSPTGEMHLGTVRTAIFCWLLARKTGGQFLVRIEDTDRNRFVEGSAERILEALAWLGLEADEGAYLKDGAYAEKGPHGPYTQSQNLPMYQEIAQQLLDGGHAYRCFATAEELEQMRSEQQARGELPRYDRRYRTLPCEESDARAAAGESFVIRQALPLDREVVVHDRIRGELRFNTRDLDDHVLLKSDGFPTYHLASVVDDHRMEITTVIRGEEWLPSLPKNALLYEALGWEAPAFAHVPVILGQDKSKLSKRHGARPTLDYRGMGYLPDALVNTLVFLGWSPGTEQEFFTRDELIASFSMERVNPAPAVFDAQRLDYVNGWYIRHLPLSELAHEVANRLRVDVSDERVLRVTQATQERLKRLDEIPEVCGWAVTAPLVNDELRGIVTPKKRAWEEVRQILVEVTEVLEAVDSWTAESLETALRSLVSEERKTGDVFWPVRAAVTGLPASPGAFESLWVLGKEESLVRLRNLL